MTEISIELVPRSAASLDAELAVVRERLPAVDTVNVPDLLVDWLDGILTNGGG